MKFRKDNLPTMGAFSNRVSFSVKRYYRDMSMARDRILEGSQTVETAQGRIEYSTIGNGLPVLFIHGAGGGHDMG